MAPTTKVKTATEKTKTTWEVLSQINCNDKTEKKNWLTYLSWAWAWWIVKQNYPDANYEVVKYEWKPYLFDETLWYLVTTRATIAWETIEMNLPIMDSKNKSMKATPYTYDTKWAKWQAVEAASMFDVNTAIMRCLTKNLAMFGLWHYIYAGEDLPEDKTNEDIKAPTEKKEMPVPTPIEKKPEAAATKAAPRPATMISDEQLQLIRDFRTEFKEQLDDEAFLFAVSSQAKMEKLADIPNLSKLDASKVIRYLVTLAATEVKEWREIKNELIKWLAQKQIDASLATETK